ncbi:J domain-containing protein [Burkholderia sp. MR1-5-21]
MATLYDLLGVQEDATDEEIKRAYRRAAMKAHPDRNLGQEACAHARFQEVKEAYAILSDPAQRRVYDDVYAQEMARLREEEERLQAEREAEYRRFVALALGFAERGYSRDVVFGVLLGRDCDEQLAGRIADSSTELHASRQPGASRDTQVDERATRDDDGAVKAAQHNSRESDGAKQPAPDQPPEGDARTAGEHAYANWVSTLWHGVFGLRP